MMKYINYKLMVMILLLSNNVNARSYYFRKSDSDSNLGSQVAILGYLDLINIMLIIISIILIAKIAMRYNRNNANTKKNFIELILSVMFLFFALYYYNIIINIINYFTNLL